MRRTINAYRAQPIGSREAPNTVIEVYVPFPDTNSLEEGGFLFELDAKNIEHALHEALPGGTYDQLVGLMLQRKASHFIVSHTRFDAEEV